MSCQLDDAQSGGFLSSEENVSSEEESSSSSSESDDEIQIVTNSKPKKAAKVEVDEISHFGYKEISI